MFTLVPEKSVQYVAQFLASADLNCACARFCYSVSPWVTFQKFWNIKWIKICVYCYFNIFMLRRRILQCKRKFRRPLSSMWDPNCKLHPRWFTTFPFPSLSPASAANIVSFWSWELRKNEGAAPHTAQPSPGGGWSCVWIILSYCQLLFSYHIN